MDYIRSFPLSTTTTNVLAKSSSVALLSAALRSRSGKNLSRHVIINLTLQILEFVRYGLSDNHDNRSFDFDWFRTRSANNYSSSLTSHHHSYWCYPLGKHDIRQFYQQFYLILIYLNKNSSYCTYQCQWWGWGWSSFARGV